MDISLSVLYDGYIVEAACSDFSVLHKISMHMYATIHQKVPPAIDCHLTSRVASWLFCLQEKMMNPKIITTGPISQFEQTLSKRCCNMVCLCRGAERLMRRTMPCAPPVSGLILVVSLVMYPRRLAAHCCHRKWTVGL